MKLAAYGEVKHASFSMIGPRVDPAEAKDIDEQHRLRPRGWLVIGTVDESYYKPPIAWCDALIKDHQRWVVKLDEVCINGIPICKDQLAFIDTGFSYISTSKQRFDEAMAKLNGILVKDNMFQYPTRTLEGDSENALDGPKGVSFVLGQRFFALKQCDFSLGEGDQPGYSVSSITKLDSWPTDMWVLGGIFLDNIVTIFDYDKQRVGFADQAPQEPINKSNICTH